MNGKLSITFIPRIAKPEKNYKISVPCCRNSHSLRILRNENGVQAAERQKAKAKVTQCWLRRMPSGKSNERFHN
jgi:hypothetical protein